MEIRNFRVYDGEHAVDLAVPTPERNIYLVGGLNGAGKTSLFSAVVLGLFGRDAGGLAFERRSNENLDRAYGRYLHECFSLGARARAENEMAISLALVEHSTTLRICRKWWFEDGQVEDESLEIYKGSQPLPIEASSEADRKQILQEYVDGLAPARVAKFFFFDGEEIRSIAARDPDQAVIDGIAQLLGFGPLQKLIEDLDTLRASTRREVPSKFSGLAEAVDRLVLLRKLTGDAQTRLKSAAAANESLKSELAQIDAEVATLFGSSTIQSRSDALDALAAREREIAAISAEIQSLVGEVLALNLPRKLVDKASIRARSESQHRRIRQARANIRPLIDQVLVEVLGPAARHPRSDLTKGQRVILRRRLRAAWDRALDSGAKREAELFGCIPLEDLERLPQTTSELRRTARRELVARLLRRSHLRADIGRLRRIQLAFETGSRAQELLDRKAAVIGSIATSEAELQSIAQEVSRLHHEIAAEQGTVSRLELQRQKSIDTMTEIALIDNLEQGIKTFMTRLRTRRSRALEDRITEMMTRLAHKKGLAAGVAVDPETFTIRLRDKHGQDVINPSAGEKEVFALSMVWALAQISGRNLPVMIDTPLGRLDQTHRANVIEKFLPLAGEQVIVLATDSEIDGHWRNAMKPHIAQELLIDFSDDTQASRILSGKYLALPLFEGAVS